MQFFGRDDSYFSEKQNTAGYFQMSKAISRKPREIIGPPVSKLLGRKPEEERNKKEINMN